MSGVIIVDDDPTVAVGMAMLMEIEGIESHATSSPFELPFMVNRVDPDVILLDLSMPSLSGESLLKLAPTQRMRKRAAVVLFSGRPATELARLTDELDADGFICKNEDTDQIMRKVRFWITQSQRTTRVVRGAA